MATIKRAISEDAQLVPNATGQLLTPAAGITRIEITAVTMYANAATAGVELYLLPSGGSASTTTRVFLESFGLNESKLISELIGQSVEFGGSIQGNDGGNGGTGVNIIFTYTTFSGDS